MMNELEQKIFFSLLKHSLLGISMEYETWKGEWKWTSILKIVHEQALPTLVAESVMALPKELQPNAQQLLVLSKRLGGNMRRHGSLNKDLIEVFGVLKEKGVLPILLKGQGNATFYSKPLLRSCGDIDVYVGEQQFALAVDALRCWLGVDMPTDHHGKHVEFDYGKTTIELHRYADVHYFPYPNQPMQEITKRYLAQPNIVQIAGVDVAIPPVQFNALYVFCHLWGHACRGGVGFRQICDLLLILHHDSVKIDANQLESDLKALKMLDEWLLLGNLMVGYMGLPADEFPLFERVSQKKVDGFLRLIFYDGNLGKNHYSKVNPLGDFRRYFQVLGFEMQRFWRMLDVSYSWAFSNMLSRIYYGVTGAIKRL